MPISKQRNKHLQTVLNDAAAAGPPSPELAPFALPAMVVMMPPCPLA
jgi:hypothetical protein